MITEMKIAEDGVDVKAREAAEVVSKKLGEWGLSYLREEVLRMGLAGIIAAVFRPLLAERDAARVERDRLQIALGIWGNQDAADAHVRAYEAEDEASALRAALHAITRALIAADPDGESDETDLGKLALEGIARLVEQRADGLRELGNWKAYAASLKSGHETEVRSLKTEREDEAHEHALAYVLLVRREEELFIVEQERDCLLTIMAERNAALERVREWSVVGRNPHDMDSHDGPILSGLTHRDDCRRCAAETALLALLAPSTEGGKA